MSTPPRLVDVPQAEVDDLRDRLRRTRWPTPWPAGPGRPGVDADELRRLAQVWSSAYDWRRHEARINALPSHVVDVEGLAVHFLRYEGERPDALPIVLTHGWPSSVLELTALAERLASPSRHGGDSADAFTVVVPSLPGYGLTPQPAALPPALPTHEVWHRLLHSHLGFARYGAHGGDLGAGITSRLGQAHPEAVVGIHLLAVADPTDADPDSLTAQERAYLEAVAAWQAEEGAYQHQQATRPLTLSYGLSDSPVGLLAWVLEKYTTWTAGGQRLPPTFSDDYVLTQASLYWFTGTTSTSFRPYYERAQGLLVPVSRVDVPTAVAVFPDDLARPPRSWAERTYEVTRYTVMPRGGHFAAREEPELLARDITQHFRGLRSRA